NAAQRVSPDDGRAVPGAAGGGRAGRPGGPFDPGQLGASAHGAKRHGRRTGTSPAGGERLGGLGGLGGQAVGVGSGCSARACAPSGTRDCSAWTAWVGSGGPAGGCAPSVGRGTAAWAKAAPSPRMIRTLVTRLPFTSSTANSTPGPTTSLSWGWGTRPSL